MSQTKLVKHGKMKHPTLLKCGILVAFTYFHLLHSTVTSSNPPNNDEVYGKTCAKELESDELLHTYETINSGCTLDCYILKKEKSFYTRSVTKRHLLSNIQCINDSYICLNGTCIVNPLNYSPVPLPSISRPGEGSNSLPYLPPSLSRGSAIITIHSGYVRYDDVPKFNKGDIFVKVKAGSREIGRTKTIANDWYPSFEETFPIQSLSRTEPLNFELWDDNSPFSNHYINTISTTCDDIIIKRSGGKSKPYYENPSGNRLTMTINCTSF